MLTLPLLVLLLSAPLLSNQLNFTQNCNNADLYECSTSLCANFAWTNGTCRVNSSSPCLPRVSVYDGSECVNCRSLSDSNCTAFCPDYYYAPATKLCTPCWVTFGAYCVGCTTTACTECAYSSRLVVSSNGTRCVVATCADQNCVSCTTIQGQSRCQTCKTGYVVNSLFGCTSVSCTIPYCSICQDRLACKRCVDQYVLSADQLHCTPNCPQTECISCCEPGICQKCVYGYTLVNGICVVDCSKSVVAHCAACVDLCTCTNCIANYSLIYYGALCIPDCFDLNCEYCSAPEHCVYCNAGYFLNQFGVCVQNVCPVQYCEVCLNLQQCLQCQVNFTLSADNLTCFPTCTLIIPNCILCLDATTCQTCAVGYNLTNNTCVLVCNVTNCAVCATATTCAICEANFTLSADKQACTPTITIPNCVTSPGNGTCLVCKPGYSKVTFQGLDYCVVLCGPGQINAGTIINPICLVCGVQIEFCQSCVSNGNGSLVCVDCPNGYYIDSAGYCALCSQAIDNCWTCNGVNNCTACFAGYVLLAGQCVSYQCNQSVSNCLMCRTGNPYFCQTCLTGFIPDGKGSCYISCPPTYCFDYFKTKCICHHGTYDANGKCNPCADANCYECTVAGCIVCNEGYYLSQGKCLPCPPHCASCTCGQTCDRCIDGFGLGRNYTCITVGNGVCVGMSTSGQLFQCPPCCSQCTVSTTGAIVCMQSQPGCSIVGGGIITCDASCKTCSGTTNISCTSCYPGQFLIGGECRNCSDIYATACLSNNHSFSTDCVAGYTATFCTGLPGGICRPCAPNCIQCDAAGPGKCDQNKCEIGYVILVGTTNCTECIGGQPTCSPFNPVTLVNCLNGQYRTQQNTCSPCPQNCSLCVSATNCTGCIAGYALINGACYVIPANCVGLNADLTCSACLSNYVLSADKKSCIFPQSCNVTLSCSSCPPGTYLSHGCCLKCSLLSNCLQCNKYGCAKCADGYYVSNGICVKCPVNCSKCTSATVCTVASSGHFVPVKCNKPSGKPEKCHWTCRTCSSYKSCITCATGCSFQGSQCLPKKRVNLGLVLKGNGKPNSIFKDNEKPLNTLFNGLSCINRIRNSICFKLPSAFGCNSYEVCLSTVQVNYASVGSFIVDVTIVPGPYTSGQEAVDAISKIFESGTILDGSEVFKSTVSAEGFEDSPNSPTTTSQPTNWGLILGLSIPLATLLIVIVAIIVVRRKEEPVVTAERTAGQSCQTLEKRGEEKL